MSDNNNDSTFYNGSNLDSPKSVFFINEAVEIDLNTLSKPEALFQEHSSDEEDKSIDDTNEDDTIIEIPDIDEFKPRKVCSRNIIASSCMFGLLLLASVILSKNAYSHLRTTHVAGVSAYTNASKTEMPSTMISTNPSMNPTTSFPSPQPSSIPSYFPSLFPSDTPSLSLVPSKYPSSGPSISFLPTTNLPSSRPSPIPSYHPSINPSKHGLNAM